MTPFRPTIFFKVACHLCALGGFVVGMIGSSFDPNDGQTRALKIAFLLSVGFSILFGTLHLVWSRSIEADNSTITRDAQPFAFWINIVAGFVFSAAVFTLLIVVLISP